MDARLAETAPSLPYHEPAVVTILLQSSFLLLLNGVNVILDRLLYCGLIGQVLLGIAWGTPGAKWLSSEAETVIVQFGYLGLILLVYEGGLSTSFKSLKANAVLSAAVALTGVGVPVGLSYILQPLLGATPIQAFAAGAALCSTSLGTTFTVLASSGLSSTRLGVVLTSAAMMDDVVGLVMVQVIASLGQENISAVVIVRPILVSVAFAIIIPLLCRLCVKPSTIVLNRFRENHPDARTVRLLCLEQTPLVVHTALLLGLVAGASYAGTSNLFAAYMAGAVVSWWDKEVPHPLVKQKGTTSPKAAVRAAQSPPYETGVSSVEKENRQDGDQSRDGNSSPGPGPQQESDVAEEVVAKEDVAEDTSGSAIYERYYRQAVGRILQPLFFASIGFSIPITRMFRGSIVWRGVVYATLMAFGKTVCGLWLVRFSLAPLKGSWSKTMAIVRLPSIAHFWGKKTDTARPAGTQEPRESSIPTNGQTRPAPKPFSLHPPIILACAMTARGEIGFLISSVAEANGVFSSDGQESGSSSDLFLIVTWAIVLCTILGPLGVGLSVRRVKELEKRKNMEQGGSGRDVLGVWGVN